MNHLFYCFRAILGLLWGVYIILRVHHSRFVRFDALLNAAHIPQCILLTPSIFTYQVWMRTPPAGEIKLQKPCIQ